MLDVQPKSQQRKRQKSRPKYTPKYTNKYFQKSPYVDLDIDSDQSIDNNNILTDENNLKNEIETNIFFVEELTPKDHLYVPNEIITNCVAFENNVSDSENQTVLLVEEEVSKKNLSFPIKTFALIKNPENIEIAYKELLCPKNFSSIDHNDNKEIIQFCFPNISSINHRITLNNFFRLRSDKLTKPGRSKESLWIG